MTESEFEKLVDAYHEAVLVADHMARKNNALEPLIGANNRMEDARAALIAAFREAKGSPLVHGKNCEKIKHGQNQGHLHSDDDDSPFDVDGVSYCGRCHMAL